jgi:hypothetical protein
MDGDEARGRERPSLRPAAPPPAQTPPAAKSPADPASPAGREADEKSADKPTSTTDPTPAAEQPKIEQPAAEQPAPAAVRRHQRLPFARALRRVPAPRAAARRVGAWSRRPSGRLAVPGGLLALMVLTAGAAGIYLVPAFADRAAAPAASPSATSAPPPLPDLTALPSVPPTIGGSLGPTGPVVAQRPADTLKGWAAQMAPRVNVPQVALEAYGYAELVAAQTLPTCGLKWTTLAAIGKVESNHGSANDATLLADGRALPAILGAPLTGSGGTLQVRDTDNGILDGDRVWDRAVGPMQFIPNTWESQAVDADNDGMRDPSDIDDAALAAANYLCRGGRNLNEVGDWWAAILTYNDVQPYARAVYQAANDYGARSRT